MIAMKNSLIPCLHRIHEGKPLGVHQISSRIGMSIELTNLINRLSELNAAAEENQVEDRSVLVTFDDGWSDVVLLIDFFESAKKLQPVLFLTRDQILGNTNLLPLSRLYAWCDSWSLGLEKIDQLGISRATLKSLPEDLQHSILDDLDVPRTHISSQVLELEQISQLQRRGWIIASHAHDHHDLRFDDASDLLDGLTKARNEIVEFGGEPWLAWPEGRCTMRTCEIAKKAGFTKQFSLDIEAGNVNHPDLIPREIWS